MSTEMEEGYFLEMLSEEEKRAREEKILEQVEEWEKKNVQRKDWWIPADAELAETLLTKPEGFLANDQLFRRGNVCQIIGPGGSYKTWFAMFAQGQWAFGKPIGKIPSRKCNTLLLSEELNIEAMLDRAKKFWTKAERDEIGESIAFRSDSNLDFFSRTSESQKKLDYLIHHTNDPDVILVDSQSYIHHGDENSNRDMGIVFGALKDVAKQTGTCLPIIHHTGLEGDRGRGATVVRDICSDIILIENVGGRGRPKSKLQFKKHRDLKDMIFTKPFVFSIEDHPAEPNRVVFAFSDEEIQTAKPEDIAAMSETVYELAGRDGEVMREALWQKLVVSERWGKLRFKATLSEAVLQGTIGRKSQGRSSSFYVPVVLRPEEQDLEIGIP